jgi:hypothetical protein
MFAWRENPQDSNPIPLFCQQGQKPSDGSLSELNLFTGCFMKILTAVPARSRCDRGRTTMRDTRYFELSTSREYATESPIPADPWEAVCLPFETTGQEIRERFRALNVNKWHRKAAIVELFCGRGNGLRALNLHGFPRIERIGLSARLVPQYRGHAKCHVGDCWQLHLPTRAKTLLLFGQFASSAVAARRLERTLAQLHRLLRKDGKVLLVESWLTPFLRFADFAKRKPWRAPAIEEGGYSGSNGPGARDIRAVAEPARCDPPCSPQALLSDALICRLGKTEVYWRLLWGQEKKPKPELRRLARANRSHVRQINNPS